MVGVPYKSGGEAVAAVLGQQVHATFEAISILLPLIRSGKVRALAITSASRTPLALDLPTMIEAGVPGYEVMTFQGVVAPAGTPEPIVALLNATINEALATAENRDAIIRLGSVPSPASPQEFRRFIGAQVAKWTAVAQAANVKID